MTSRDARDSASPIGALASRGYVGRGFFSRTFDRATAAEGLVDRIERYAHAGLDPSRVHAEVRRFYERTTELALVVLPRWSAWARPFGRVFAWLATKLGNLVLPTDERRPIRIASEIFALPDDGVRTVRRGSERAYEDGRCMYIAAYAVHERDGTGYMNIALPLPWATMVSVLRMDDLDHGGIHLTSRARRDRRGDEGLFVRLGPLVVPIPLSEELWLRPRAERAVPKGLESVTDATLVALHRFRVFGVVCLELDYVIGPAAS